MSLLFIHISYLLKFVIDVCLMLKSTSCHECNFMSLKICIRALSTSVCSETESVILVQNVSRCQRRD